MERRFYEAAVEGSVESLLKLLPEDPLLLDRSMVSCYSETPLHIASMLGHETFVQEILSRKPELSGELDSRRSSALHLATAKGHLGIVQKLVLANPEMCCACDRDGKNPLHVAAIKGHVTVLRKLVQVRPEACRILMDRGETILHACVNYNQLECLKLLVETLNDHEFVNSKDDDGNTILHLAVIDKQVETIKFLTDRRTTLEVNAVNANGFTALDILARRKLDVNRTIRELLRCAGARSQKETREPAPAITQTPTGSIITSHSGDPSNQGREPAPAITQTPTGSIITSHSGDPSNQGREPAPAITQTPTGSIITPHSGDPSNQGREPAPAITQTPTGSIITPHSGDPSNQGREPAPAITQTPTGSIITPHSGDPSNQGREGPENAGEKKKDWFEKKRNTLMVVASLIATMAFQAGLNPPGGVWQDDSQANDILPHHAGCPVMLTQDEFFYNLFFGFNTTGFVASLSIILLLISGIPFFKRRFFMGILTVIMWVAISAMALAYLFAILGITYWGNSMMPWYASTYVLFGWIGFIGILILAHIVRLIVKMIKYFLMKRSARQPSSLDAQVASTIGV